MQDVNKGRTLKIDIRSLGMDMQAAPRLPKPGQSTIRKEDVDYKYIFDTQYDSVLITNRTGQVVSCNGRAVKLFGYEAEGTLVGVSIKSLIGGMTDSILIQIAETVIGRRYMRLEAFGYRKDGGMIATEVIVSGTRQDQSANFLFMVRDIQARYQAEQKLQSAFHAMDNTDSGIGIVDLEGHFTYGNRTLLKMLGGGDESKVVGQSIAQWFDGETVVQPLVAAVSEAKTWTGETKLPGENGLTVQVSVIPDINADGELQGMVFSLVDAAPIKRAELAEYQLDRDRAMMETLSEACHAIGQPATILLSTIEVLRSTPDLDAESRSQMLDMCYSAMLELRDHLQEMNAARLSVKKDLVPTGRGATSAAALFSSAPSNQNLP